MRYENILTRDDIVDFKEKRVKHEGLKTLLERIVLAAAWDKLGSMYYILARNDGDNEDVTFKNVLTFIEELETRYHTSETCGYDPYKLYDSLEDIRYIAADKDIMVYGVLHGETGQKQIGYHHILTKPENSVFYMTLEKFRSLKA